MKLAIGFGLCPLIVDPPSETAEPELSRLRGGLERLTGACVSLLDFRFDRPSQLSRML